MGEISTNKIRVRKQPSKKKTIIHIACYYHNVPHKLEGNLKGMGKYDIIKIDKDGIEISKLIRTICHLQDDDKQDIMSAVETNK